MTSKPLAPGHLHVEQARDPAAAGRSRRWPRCRSGTPPPGRPSPRARAACAAARGRAVRRRRRGRATCAVVVMPLARPPRRVAAGCDGRESRAARPALCRRPRTRAVRRAVQALQAIARVREADAAPQLGARAGAEADAVVADLDPQLVAVAARADLHQPVAGLRRHPMLDRVLHQRLQDQPRHFGVERLRVDVEAHRQPILEPRLLDLEIFLQELQLLLQRHAGRAGSIERDAQQIAQPADHPIGGVGVGVDERRDRVQRVEQEMRVQLGLERPQPRFDQSRLELRCLQRPPLRFAVVGERIAQADDCRVHHQRPVEIGQELPLNVGRPPHGRRLAAKRHDRVAHRNHARAVEEGEAHRQREVHPDQRRPMPGAGAQPVRQPENRRHQQRGHVPIRAVEDEEPKFRRVGAGSGRQDVETDGLERREDDQRRRDGEHPPERRGPGTLHC